MKILLADDSMTAQKMGKEILLAAGHEVVTVSNGAAAVKKIASERPDVAVLDVYMPGYTGLEVCERIKSDPATAQTPVLLTHGKMENYSAQDGARVKADGVIIKPFEASDLVAAVQKLGEQKSAAAAAAAAAAPAEEPAYQKTAKFNVKELLAADPSYNEWKTSAVEHVEETMESGARPTSKIEVPHDMASAPAFGIEEEPPPVEHPTMAEPPATVIAPFPHEPAPVEMELSTAPPPAPLVPMRDPHLEPTSARDTTEVEHSHDPNFEAPLNHRNIKVEHSGMDPALITDPDQMNAEFKTKFGVEHPDEISVGVAADIPQLYADSAPPVADAVPPTEDVSTAAQQVAPPAHKDDFDARVAEAMSAFDSQKLKAMEEPPAVQEPPKAEAPTLEAEPEPVVEVVETSHEAPPPAADLPPTMKLEPATEKFAPPTESVPVTPEPPAPESNWKAQTVTLDTHEHGISLEDEMQKAFAAAAHAEPEPAPVAAPPAPPEPAPETHSPDLRLAAEMAAAIGADDKTMAAAAGAEGEPHPEHEKIMTAVFNVFERMKPELIEQVKRELKEKK